MKEKNALKLSFLAAFAAVLGAGCASTGYARYDADEMGARGSAGSAYFVSDEDMAPARVTVSALSFTPDTRAAWVNKFPFYNYNFRVIETYTFAVPDPSVRVAATADLPQFSVDLPPGSVFVEAAGGEGEVRTGRVIQHSPNPTR